VGPIRTHNSILLANHYNMFKATGVTITSNLPLSDHIHIICFKKQKISGLTAPPILQRCRLKHPLSVQPVISTCRVSSHIWSMHAQPGTPISLMRLPNCRMCQRLLSITIQYAAHLGSWIMRAFWHICMDMPFLRWRKLQLKVKWCTILCMATVSSLKVHYSHITLQPPVLLYHIMQEQTQFFFHAHATLLQ